MIKVGDPVIPVYTGITYAPVETVGVSGFVTGVLDGIVDGIKYRNKYIVSFVEPIADHRSWIFDEVELEVEDLIPMSSQEAYR